MQIPVIKKLVETYSLSQLEEAESAILEERSPSVEIGGADEGEQLTNAMAASWIMRDIEASGCDFKTAVRAYSQKVRNSIS